MTVHSSHWSRLIRYRTADSHTGTARIQAALRSFTHQKASARVIRSVAATEFLQAGALVLELLEPFLASSAFIPSYWDIQRDQVDSAVANSRQTSSTVMPPTISLWPSVSLRTICSDVRRRRGIVITCRLHNDADKIGQTTRRSYSSQPRPNRTVRHHGRMFVVVPAIARTAPMTRRMRQNRIVVPHPRSTANRVTSHAVVRRGVLRVPLWRFDLL